MEAETEGFSPFGLKNVNSYSISLPSVLQFSTAAITAMCATHQKQYVILEYEG